MLKPKSTTLQLLDYLLSLSPKHFSGRLDFLDCHKQQWSIYFDKGRIDWATGGLHPRRRWRRNMMKYCPNLSNKTLIQLEENAAAPQWYHLLTVLLEEKQISQTEVVAITKNTVTEVLFDLIQQQEVEKNDNNSLLSTCDRRDVLKQPIIRISVYEVLEEIQRQWEGWRKAKLINYSPNLAPVLKVPGQLQQQVSPTIYQKLKTAMSKGLTLRDLAVYLKQDLLKLTQSLMPYINKGTIQLVEVADLAPPIVAEYSRANRQNVPLPGKGSGVPVFSKEALRSSRFAEGKELGSVKKNRTIQKYPTRSGPVSDQASLIACIDDCPLTQKLLKGIIAGAGYRFLGIQQAMVAVSTLIEQKPDLILLDLVMPIANGYEICSQIRRVSLLKDVPIIILTGSDGLVDRVRAKMVGCSDFIAKPVEAEKILNAVHNYLGLKVARPGKFSGRNVADAEGYKSEKISS